MSRSRDRSRRHWRRLNASPWHPFVSLTADVSGYLAAINDVRDALEAAAAERRVKPIATPGKDPR